MKHELKIEQVYLDALLDGSKTFEVRYNDRGYNKGDVLQFYGRDVDYEWKELFFEVTYVHSGVGLKEFWVVLAVKQVKEATDGELVRHQEVTE